MNAALRFFNKLTNREWRVVLEPSAPEYRHLCEYTVRFYDLSLPETFGDTGQFVSDYLVSTLIARGSGGLCLDGGNADVWSIDAEGMKTVMEFIYDSLPAKKAEKKYYDILTLSAIHKLIGQTIDKAIANGNINTAEALQQVNKQLTSFMQETDTGMDEMRLELEQEMNTARSTIPQNNLISRNVLSWANYKHDVCENLTSDDDMEMNVPDDREFGDE